MKYNVDGLEFRNIRRIKDLDGNGIDELILDELFINTGMELIRASAVSIGSGLGGAISVTEDFGYVYISDFSGTGTGIKASVISIMKDTAGMVIFKRENYVAKCTRAGVQIDISDAVCQSFERIEKMTPNFQTGN